MSTEIDKLREALDQAKAETRDRRLELADINAKIKRLEGDAHSADINLQVAMGKEVEIERRLNECRIKADGDAKLADLIGARGPKKVYVGRDSGCRCGCGGNYHDVGTRGFKVAMTKAAKVLGSLQHTNIDNEDTLLDISYPDDRSITIYFED